MIKTTSYNIEGHSVTDYCGIVSSEVIFGANLFRDIFASLRDIFGGRSNSYEKVFQDARNNALAEIERKALALGADAIIGIQFNYNSVGQRGSMLMVSITGTAVKITK